MSPPPAPSTRFRGSKRKLLPWLKQAFAALDFDSAADLMSGTASVAHLLKSMGKRVVANDILHCHFTAAKGLIENSRERVSEAEINALLAPRPAAPPGFIAETFAGMYFTADENAWLDRAASNIARLESAAKRALALHALIQAALMKRPFNLFHRRNLAMREARVKRSFGNAATWNAPFEALFRKRLEEANAGVFDNGRDNRAMRADAADAECAGVDLIYIDPPYFRERANRKESDYAHLYHFAEGLARYSEWPALIDQADPLRALKAQPNSLSRLYRCPARDLAAEFARWLARLLENWPNAQVALSYREPGVPDAPALAEVLAATGRRVDIRRAAHRYALSRAAPGGGPGNHELLLIAN